MNKKNKNKIVASLHRAAEAVSMGHYSTAYGILEFNVLKPLMEEKNMSVIFVNGVPYFPRKKS